ncbi:MAG: rod shape-determining protein [Candidatus Campbellbacteria bacterium]|nr:rod shape-determining protein [Candidatus Campbellbacteria bacterium]
MANENTGKRSWGLRFSFRNDIGIDLGTANTLVYVHPKGIVIDEPSVVAVNKKTGRVVAVGKKAREMVGRTPAHIEAINPLVDGVISDFEIAEEMLAHLLRRAREHTSSFIPPRVLVGVPSGITNVEIRAVRDAAKNAGARSVNIIEEPMAAAIGIGLPVLEANGNMVVDIGGGTTDIAVISLGGIVQSKNLRVAGDHLNQDIIRFLKEKYKLQIGEKTAENIKIELGSVVDEKKPLSAKARGRDLVTGLPKEIEVTDSDVKEAILVSIEKLIEAVKNVVETMPPEVMSDIMKRGIYITGGGALLRGLDSVLESFIKVPFYLTDDPLTTVARGTGIVLNDFDRYKEILIQNDDEQPTE